jgi:NTP pyrophosphatase (non-canonical NTP hydrolase)
MFKLIRAWARKRGILKNSNSKDQYIKLLEEIGELAHGLSKNDKAEIKDAIGDCVVVLTNLAALEKLKIEDCIQSAYEIINKRNGKMVNGFFVKDEK